PPLTVLFPYTTLFRSLRPLVFRGYGPFGVNPLNNPVETYIASWVWEKYLGQDSTEQGVDVCVASWARMQGNTLPATAKAAANYIDRKSTRLNYSHQII